MKKIFTLMVILLTILAHGRLMAQDTACPPGLIHYWKFDENDTLSLKDYIGSLDAIVIDKTFLDSGKVGRSQYFDESRLSLFDPESFDWDSNSSFTIEVWINKTSACPSPSSINNSVIIGRDAYAETGLHWWLGVSCTNPGKINFSLYANGFEGQVLESKKGVIDGEWHLISVVRNGTEGTTSILIDGVVDTTTSFTYTNGFSSDDSVDIGWLNLHKFYHFEGRMDELAVYSSALDDSV
ncbi:MAG TPA: LamG domain-containing protein, partial [Bacteroidales bacterium]|nr:LamG domain-containing protein [Bacteroidales bacterium]